MLVTGGAGYIGSHTMVEMLNAGYHAVIIDNLVNSYEESLRRVKKITGKEITFYNVDLCNKEKINDVFKKHKFTDVIHFAGLKAVGESCSKPLLYYQNNLEGTMNLLQVMSEHGVHNMIFSSSCTVYGEPQCLPLDENHAVGGCTNPYGKTKYFIEEIMSDLCKAEKDWNVILLRYFNPVGSHVSGLIGEDPQGPPNNLMPYVAQVAVGRREKLSVFGDDYDTPDGTGVRDYIHVVDLALGHVAAINKLRENCGCKVYNLGTGTGYSVLDMVKAFEKASGRPVPYQVVGRRDGDLASVYADPKLAKDELGWTATRGLEQMCEDLWRWQKMNPQGYDAVNADADKQTNGH